LTQDDFALILVGMSDWKTVCRHLFSSHEVNDIIDHFTPDEALSYHSLAHEVGGRYGARLVGPGSVATVVISSHTAKIFPHVSSALILLAFSCVFWVIARVLARPMHQHLRAFLCSTAYAQQSGYQPEKLRLSRLSFS
jgi:hypothetical protein